MLDKLITKSKVDGNLSDFYDVSSEYKNNTHEENIPSKYLCISILFSSLTFNN